MNLEDVIYKNENNPISISYKKWADFNMAERHFHSTFEIFYVFSGERYFFIDDGSYKINEGELVIIAPNILHKAINTEKPGCERINIYFDEELGNFNYPISEALSSLLKNDKKIINLNITEKTSVEELFRKMIYEIQIKKTGYEMSLQALLIQLLVAVCRYIEENPTIQASSQSYMHKKAAEIVQYINEHYMEPISLNSISENFYISRSYLSKIFKEATTFTLVEYLNNVRIKEAKKLLNKSNLKVTEICEKVGFGSITHFGRIFKEVTGHAPLYYKKG